MQLDLIFQVIVGVGMIGGMWRLVREVSGLSTAVTIYVKRTDRNETEIDSLRQEIADVRSRVRS